MFHTFFKGVGIFVNKVSLLHNWHQLAWYLMQGLRSFLCQEKDVCWLKSVEDGEI